MRTVSVRLVNSILNGAQCSDIEPAAVLQKAAINQAIFIEPRNRISLEEYAAIAESQMEILNDETLGLFDKPQKTGSFKHLTQSCINLNSLGEAIENSIELINLLDHPVSIEWVRGKKHSILRLNTQSQRPTTFTGIEYFMSALYRFFCWLSDAKIDPVRIEFSHAKQIYTEEYFHFFLGSELGFNGKHNQITFTNSILNSPIRKTPSSLRRLLKNTPVILLMSPVNKDDIASGTRLFLEKHIIKHSTLPDIEDISEHYNMSKATFRRALRKQGITYNEIKQQVKRDLAIHYLTKKQLTVEKTTQLTGFSETSAFVRAFKTWTGMTPAHYRQQANLK